MDQRVVNELRKFIARNFLFSEEFSLSDTASFLESGIIDSMRVLELILFLEERYEITLADEEVVPENLDSIESLKSFVERKLKDMLCNETVQETVN
jgi:acyl carrier protein